VEDQQGFPAKAGEREYERNYPTKYYYKLANF